MTRSSHETAPAVAAGAIPDRRARIIVLSALAGLIVAILWSAKLVDDEIGVTVANGMLGQDPKTATIDGTFAGLLFAFTTGVAGTFTACNVAVFSALTPIVDHQQAKQGRLVRALRPLGWLTLGAVAISAIYGAAGALLGARLPQLSSATFGENHAPVRILQSVGVFSLIGIVMLYLGLAALKLVPDPLARLTARWAPAPQVVMGVLIGGFLIGRPWPMFFKMFQQAASTHNPLYGAAVFTLVAIGNILIMALLFLALSATRFPAWLRARPSRVATVTAAALLVGGAFTLFYWGFRVPAHFGIGWFPSMPWS